MKPNIKYIVLILSLMLSIFLAGCMNENTENENNQIVDENKKEVISSSPVEDFSQLTLLESFNYDYDLDGTEEAINLYTSAQKIVMVK